MEFLIKIKEKWQTVLVITLIITAVVFSISAFLKPQYESEIGILVIQRQPSDKVDAFSAAKSAEYLSDILAKVAYTESFVQNVLDSPYDAEIDFPLEDEEKKKYWSKKVDVDQVNNTGIIRVSVYDQDRANAEKIAESIAWAYIIRGHQYHGGGERVEIEKIDGPITPENPTKPNLALNTLLGFILGIMGSLAVIYFFDDFDLKIFGKREKFDGSEIDYNEQDEKEEKNFSLNGVMKFREKHGDYSSFEDYVFDKERKESKSDLAVDDIEDVKKNDDEEVFTEESGDIKNQSEIEEIKESSFASPSHKASEEQSKAMVDKEEEKKFIEIHEPNSFDGELSFEDVLVESPDKKETVAEVDTSVASDGAPGNLPTFEGDVNSLVKGGGKETTDEQVETQESREPTEDEIKEKLNKLLRGEM